ncbi:MAG: triose-phosphate isomerase family protein [Patescibacteria group bacterium]
MKSLFIVGNWKSNKGIAEAHDWLRQFNAKCQMPNAKWKDLAIVLCVPYTLLNFLHDQIKQLNLPIVLGAQDVSPFGDGAYTGAVSARQVKEFADWVIIGHSERRKYFGETDEVLAQKVAQAKTAGLNIIYCVSDENTVIPDGVDAVAYEPVWAIGTGKAETPEHANAVIAGVKAKTQIRSVIYGGSVTPDNVASFLAQPAIDGVLPGGASLDAGIFAALILASQGQALQTL